MKSFMASPSNIERKWYVVDATGHTLGRLSSEIASILRGKNKPTFTPHIDTGDYVVVVNADKIKVTGKKMEQKIYYHRVIDSEVTIQEFIPALDESGVPCMYDTITATPFYNNGRGTFGYELMNGTYVAPV